MGRIVQFSGPRLVEVVDQQPTPMKPGQIRVRTRYSGISAGTELTAYRGTNPYLNLKWDADRRLFLDDSATHVDYPVAGLGYSEVGVITELADDVRDLPGVPAEGDLVWGIWGHRSEALLPADRFLHHALPAHLDPIAGTFVRGGAVALNAVLAAGIHLGETVAIFGQGVLGLLTTRLAALSGAEVAAVDALAVRLARAKEYGALLTHDASAGSAAAELRAVTGGRGADVAIEISGSYRALHEAIRSVGAGGRVVAAGFYQGDGIGLRLGEEFHHNRVELVSSQISGVPAAVSGRWDQDRLNRTFLRLVAGGQVDPTGLVSHVLPVERAAEAYELLDQRPADALQVVLEFEC
ncbi:zinc-binding alcohol dehydrogenase [Actinomycetes bacterium KLBMP 9797]